MTHEQLDPIVLDDVAAMREAVRLPPIGIASTGIRVEYGPDPNQFGQLFLPSGDAAVPVAVVVHGGRWRSRFTLGLGTPLAFDLSLHGVAAWNIEFRRVGNGGGWPTTCDDVASAVDALPGVVQEAAGGRLDWSNVAVVGHSSGGHLAAWLTSRYRLVGQKPGVSLKGAVIQAGVLDLVARAADKVGEADAGAIEFMGGPPAVLPDQYAMASPIELLPIGLPIVCVHGDADPTVPISQSERYVEAARAAGDFAQLVVLPGIGHFEVIDPDSTAWATCRDAIMSLLK